VHDLVVAATAEHAGLTVLHCDRDFELIATVTGQVVERISLPWRLALVAARQWRDRVPTGRPATVSAVDPAPLPVTAPERDPPMARYKFITAAFGVVAAAGLGLGATSLANASSTTTPTPSATSGSESGAPDGGHHGHGSPGTPLTATELASVTAAVKAKDAAITVTNTHKDSDGSFDAFGTKAGANVKVEVSKDLSTITVEAGGDHGGPGGHSKGTPVTGTELAAVTAAVKAKDSTITVSHVRKDPDGSYDAAGTKAGNHVVLEVSKDLATITTRTFVGK
jgi:hypothetical protein